MANYSQPPPPYGVPFHFAPQQSAPAPQVDSQGGPSDPRQMQVPSAEALQQMWNWNLNQQAYGQNSQQPSYPMWPPPSLYQQSEGAPLPFPPPFMTQNGFIPPPPPGSIFYPPPPLPQAPAQNTPASSAMRAPVFAPTPIHPAQPIPTLNTSPPQQSIMATNDRVVEMMDSDKEDGEVSDGDRTTRSPAFYNRPVAEPPRSVPQGPRESLHNVNVNKNDGQRHDYAGPVQPSQNDDHHSYDRKDSYPSRPEAMPQTISIKGLDNLPQKRDDAMRFVRDLHDHRIGYTSLAAEGLDPQLLKDLYRRSNIPLPHEPARATAKASVQAPVNAPIRAPAQAASQTPVQVQNIMPVREPKTNGDFTSSLTTSYSNVRYPKPPTTDAAPQSVQTKPTPALKTNIAQTPPVKSAPSPIDRKDYIARLQAAKMAKQSAGNKVTSPQQTPPPKAIQTTDAMTTTAFNPPQSSIDSNGNNVPKVKQPATEEEKARKTELIRQRLEAMRAKQIASSPAAPQASKSVTPSATTAAEAFLSTLQNTVHVQSPTPQPSQVAQPFQTSQTAQSFSTPSFSGIPGLFMNASTPNIGIPGRHMHAAPPQVPPVQPQNTITTSTKRRAVASDLEEVTTPTSSGPAYTRPLGQSPHDHDGESMIIEVSDDESGGSEMDLDDDQPVSKAVAVSTPDAHQIGQQRLRNFPPLTDFPSRSTSVKPASSAVSTPGPQTPATFARKEELQKKEKDLADLKLRLMLKMQEQRQLKAAAAASSPMPQKATKQTGPITSLPPLQPKLVDPNHSLQTNTFAATSTSTAQVLARESKKRRRAEIESGLPSLEAEIANNTARMAQIAKEMEELKANNEKISQDKEKLVRELESLGIDTEGMPHAELQAKKDEIDQELQSETLLEPEETTVTASSPSQPPKDVRNGNRSVSSSMTGPSEPKINSISDDSLVAQLPEEVEPVEGHVPVPEVEAAIAVAPLPVAQPEAASLPAVDDKTISESRINGAAEPEVVSANMMRKPQQQDPVNSVPTTIPGATMTEAATPVDDDEDFYSPEPTITITLDNEAAIEKALEPAVVSPSEGEIEMSESSADEEEEEEEYEPEEPQVVHPMADIEGSPAAPASALSDDEEMYEPPEPELNHHIVDINSNTVNTSNIPIIQPAEEDDAMDMSTSSSVESDSDSDESDFAQQSASEHANHNSISFNNVPDLSSTVADNAAPHLHFQTVPMVQPAATEPIPKATDVVESAGFVPYESPLRMFKSYRYHPSFSQDVSGGFLSMTYSHQIDPEKPLCQFESVGGTCNDPECADQHFRGMNISGEKLLVQLGTANPGKTPDEKQLWNDGLRGVLKELRQKNIKDPNGIAVEIAKYRRQFLNDDTRVVNL